MLEFETASALWSLLIPLDPGSDFPQFHLDWWTEFLIQRGSRAVSKDTWNLVSSRRSSATRFIRALMRTSQFLEFVRTIDKDFLQYDEEGELGVLHSYKTLMSAKR